MGWRLSVGVFHAFLVLSEMMAQAFSPASRSSSGGSSTGYRHHQPQLKHSSRSGSSSASQDPRRPATTRLEATPQDSELDGDIWWDGDIDPWAEAKSRVRVPNLSVQ